MPVKKIYWSALCLSLSLALTACGGGNETKTTTGITPPKESDKPVVIGGEYLSTTTADPKTFNTALAQETNSTGPLSLVFEGLVTENGVTTEVEPELAEKWEISKDGKRIVFTLREGLKWSDGAPLTADDVLFTFNDIYFNLKIPTDSRDVLRIGENQELPKLEKVDARTVAFNLPEPFAPFMRSVGLAILPKHILEKTIKETNAKGEPKFLTTWAIDTDVTTIVGNGLYVFQGYAPGQRIRYQINPNYWRRDKEGRQQPYITNRTIQIVPNIDATLLKFQSGQSDAYGLRGEDFELLKPKEKEGGYTIYNGGPDFGELFVAFNLLQGKNPANNKPFVNPVKSAWFNDVKFRQAVAYALDRQTMLDNIYRGLGALQNSPVSVPSPFYLKPEDGLPVYTFNIEKSKTLLKEAGFFPGGDGKLKDKNGNQVRFTLVTNTENSDRAKLASQMKADLQKIGITLDVLPLNFNTIVKKLDVSHDWDLVLIGFTGGIEPNGGANVWRTDGQLHLYNAQPNVVDKQRYKIEDYPGRKIAPWEKEVDQMFTKGSQELDESKRKEYYKRFQLIIQEQVPVIHLINNLSLTAVRNRVQNVKYTALGGTRWNAYELFLTPTP
jgi:peptide/nickel transport system substrate-binding protein